MSRRKIVKLEPIGDRILLKVEAAETKTAGGLIIPDTAQEKTQVAKVIAVGDDKDVIKVKKGDRVMYDKYAGTSVKIDGDDHLVVKMQDIIAIAAFAPTPLTVISNRNSLSAARSSNPYKETSSSLKICAVYRTTSSPFALRKTWEFDGIYTS